jgi:hypothetical protein
VAYGLTWHHAIGLLACRGPSPGEYYFPNSGTTLANRVLAIGWKPVIVWER